MPTEPSNWMLKRSRAGATTVSSPVDSRRDTERKGRSLPFTEARCPFTACTVEMLPTGLKDKHWLGSYAYRALRSLLRRSMTGATTVSFRVDASGTLNGKGNACLSLRLGALSPPAMNQCYESCYIQYSRIAGVRVWTVCSLSSQAQPQSVQGICTIVDAAAGISTSETLLGAAFSY